MNVKPKNLLYCGLLSSVLYVATDLLASWSYPGYSSADRVYSEFLATGAPTRSFMLVVSLIYNLLVALFAVGVWKGAGPKRMAHITAAMMILYAVTSELTPLFFQMDMRGAPVTLLGGLHPLMTAVMSLFILLSIGFGGFLLGKGFRITSFATIIILVVFGFLTSRQAPDLVAGGPTPWMGLIERINIYATMLWFVLLSISLARIERREPVAMQQYEHAWQ